MLINKDTLYNEYHSFLSGTKIKVIKSPEYYLKRFSLFEELSNSIPCAVYVLDYSNQKYLFVSESCKAIIGYTAKECMEMGQREWLENCIEKEDAEVFKNKVFNRFVDEATKISTEDIRNCRFSVNYRLKRKDGVVIKVLQQSVVLESNTNGYPLLVLGIIIDITSCKPDNKILFSVSHYHPHTGIRTISSDSYCLEEKKLTVREKEIIKHIVYGHKSSKIANLLCISENTVKVHRRNILEKTKCRNVAELINYVISAGIS